MSSGHKLYNDTPDIFIKVPQVNTITIPIGGFILTMTLKKNGDLILSKTFSLQGSFLFRFKKVTRSALLFQLMIHRDKDAFELFGRENLRRQLLTNDLPDDEVVKQLVLAADQFIVERKVQAPIVFKRFPCRKRPGEDYCNCRLSLVHRLDPGYDDSIAGFVSDHRTL